MRYTKYELNLSKVILMKTAQDYIDALRRGDYFEALEFTGYVHEKYKKLLGKDYIEPDQLTSLYIFELCQTNLNQTDLDKINFLVNYFYHLYDANSQSAGKAEHAITQLARAVSFASVLPQDTVRKFKADDASDVQALLDESSGFIQLQNTHAQAADELQRRINEDWADKRTDKIRAKLKSLTPENQLKLKDGVTRIAREKQSSDYSCPIIDAMGTDKLTVLKRTVKEYKEHLARRMKNEQISELPLPALNRTDAEFTPPKVGNSRTQKLINRYIAINKLDSQLENKNTIDDEVKGFVTAAHQTCQENKPNWIERPFLDKLWDVLSLGIRVALRNRFSKEKQYAAELEEAPKLSPTPGLK